MVLFMGRLALFAVKIPGNSIFFAPEFLSRDHFACTCFAPVLPDGLDQLPPRKVLVTFILTKVYKAEV